MDELFPQMGDEINQLKTKIQEKITKAAQESFESNQEQELQGANAFGIIGDHRKEQFNR